MFHPCFITCLVPALIGSSTKRIFNASPRVTLSYGANLCPDLGDKLLCPRINQSIKLTLAVLAVNPNKWRFGCDNLDARRISTERWSHGTGQQ